MVGPKLHLKAVPGAQLGAGHHACRQRSCRSRAFGGDVASRDDTHCLSDHTMLPRRIPFRQMHTRGLSDPQELDSLSIQHAYMKPHSLCQGYNTEDFCA